MAVALHHRLARKALVEKSKQAGLHVAVWTVDDPIWIERARAIGIDALITNDPARMLSISLATVSSDERQMIRSFPCRSVSLYSRTVN